MANPKGAYNGNGKYKAEMCERVLELYKNGESDAEVAVALDISKQTLYKWIKDKPDFAIAIERGKTLSECWWQKLGRAGASGKVNIQARVYIANMKNRFGWVENPLTEDVSPFTETEKDALRLVLAQFIAKHEREY